jgi:hypothetical protein
MGNRMIRVKCEGFVFWSHSKDVKKNGGCAFSTPATVLLSHIALGNEFSAEQGIHCLKSFWSNRKLSFQILILYPLRSFILRFHFK